MKTVCVPDHEQGSITFLIGEEVTDGGRDGSCSELLKSPLIATSIIEGEGDLDLMRERSGSHEYKG